MIDTLLKAAALLSDPTTLGVMLLAAMFGLFAGAIPDLTATMATALLIPFTFFMEPVPAIAAIVTSTIGGLAGSVVPSFSKPVLAEFAVQFSSFEYFWLACLGLSCAVVVSTSSTLKGFVSLLIGLFIATIGIDGTAGHPRFTFGSVELLGGVSFIPAMIGMFAISEALRYVASTRTVARVPQRATGGVFTGLGATLSRYRLNVVRGSTIGAVAGILPGAGADIAAFRSRPPSSASFWAAWSRTTSWPR